MTSRHRYLLYSPRVSDAARSWNQDAVHTHGLKATFLQHSKSSLQRLRLMASEPTGQWRHTLQRIAELMCSLRELCRNTRSGRDDRRVESVGYRWWVDCDQVDLAAQAHSRSRQVKKTSIAFAHCHMRTRMLS